MILFLHLGATVAIFKSSKQGKVPPMKRPVTSAEMNSFFARGGCITRLAIGESGRPEFSSSWRRLTTATPARDADMAAAATIMRHDVALAD